MLSSTISLAVSVLFAARTIALPLPLALPAGNSGQCSNEGAWNCVTESSFQRCASGQWSVTMGLVGDQPCATVFGLSASTPAQAPANAPKAAPAPSTDKSSSVAKAPSTPIQKQPDPAAPATNVRPGAPQLYAGPSSNFPPSSAWLPYEQLWALNQPALAYNDSPAEIAALRAAIAAVAASSGIDARLILALIMQESGGNLRVPDTNNGVQNRGILQSHAGVGFSGEASIVQMVRDGIEGTASGDGVRQLVERLGGGVWKAVRAYNSGSVNEADLGDGKGSTPGYCSDVANRVMGAKLS